MSSRSSDKKKAATTIICNDTIDLMCSVANPLEVSVLMEDITKTSILKGIDELLICVWEAKVELHSEV